MALHYDQYGTVVENHGAAPVGKGLNLWHIILINLVN